jgi:hypothetical protein
MDSPCWRLAPTLIPGATRGVPGPCTQEEVMAGYQQRGRREPLSRLDGRGVAVRASGEVNAPW